MTVSSDDIVVAVAKIFIVDSHRLIRDGLKHNFAASPHLQVVGEAATLAQAMALMESVGADVLLTEMSPPDGDATELAAAVTRSAGRTAVVVMSRHATRESIARAMRAGARGYVLKDGPVEQIVQAVRTAATGGTAWNTGGVHETSREPRADNMLSRREREVLGLIAEGLPSKAIARELAISLRTVECHRQSIKRRLQLVGQAELVKYAVEHAAYGEWSRLSGAYLMP
jgi:DNA-binding NarL/FixJ family response regulator